MTEIQNKLNQDTYQSRWGFHPCNQETFLKLKKLYKFYWKALYRNAEWERWNRKLPKNRILRKWYRNEKGQKTHFEIIGLKPEPQRYPVFGAFNYIPAGSHALNDMGIIEAYENARMPRSSPEAVVPLKITVEKINNMISHLEKFEA